MIYYVCIERKPFKKEDLRMFIYEDLNKYEEEENKELAVSPIEYVVLNCGR